MTTRDWYQADDDDSDRARSNTAVWRDRGAIIAQQQTRIAQLEAQVARVQHLVDYEPRHLIRWIDDSHLVDVEDLRAALAPACICDEPPISRLVVCPEHPQAHLLNCPVCGSGEEGDCVCGPRGRCICNDPPVAREVVCRLHPNAHLAAPAPVSSGEAGTSEGAGRCAVQVGPRLATSTYDLARYRLGELMTPMGWRLGDVIARLVLDSNAVLPAPVVTPSTEGGE